MLETAALYGFLFLVSLSFYQDKNSVNLALNFSFVSNVYYALIETNVP